MIIIVFSTFLFSSRMDNKKHGLILFRLVTEAFDCRYHNYKVKPM